MPCLNAHLTAPECNKKPCSCSGLDNKPCIGPLLVVCFTNHALDSFLEALLDVGINEIVRVGGKGKSTRLEPYNMSNKGNKVQLVWTAAFLHAVLVLPSWLSQGSIKRDGKCTCLSIIYTLTARPKYALSSSEEVCHAWFGQQYTRLFTDSHCCTLYSGGSTTCLLHAGKSVIFYHTVLLQAGGHTIAAIRKAQDALEHALEHATHMLRAVLAADK